jgi:exonuclease SbcD
MRVLHTSDWHLGHSLHGLGREHEHREFLRWLLDTMVAWQVDALLVTGDVFDSANPPASAETLWYEFLASAHRRLPGLDVVVIAGNHDSPSRLSAPAAVLRGMGAHVVGAMPRSSSGEPAYEELVIPLHDRAGLVTAWIAAVPFLRPVDLPALPAAPGAAAGDESSPLIEGVRQIYARALECARARRGPGQALLATGHCYMVGTAISRLSERRILGGNQHALPADVFAADVTYAALGHLHKAQRVGGRDHVRYAGSPIPLALAEAEYRHQVCIAEFAGAQLGGLHVVPVPRAVEMLRLPRRGAAPLPALLPALAGLEPLGSERRASDPRRPLLEVSVALERPEPDLRLQIEQAMAGKWPRLVKVSVEYTGDGASLADGAPGLQLSELEPEDVFRRRYARDHAGEPPAEILAAFREVVAEVVEGPR